MKIFDINTSGHSPVATNNNIIVICLSNLPYPLSLMYVCTTVDKMYPRIRYTFNLFTQRDSMSFDTGEEYQDISLQGGGKSGDVFIASITFSKILKFFVVVSKLFVVVFEDMDINVEFGKEPFLHQVS